MFGIKKPKKPKKPNRFKSDKAHSSPPSTNSRLFFKFWSTKSSRSSSSSSVPTFDTTTPPDTSSNISKITKKKNKSGSGKKQSADDNKTTTESSDGSRTRSSTSSRRSSSKSRATSPSSPQSRASSTSSINYSKHATGSSESSRHSYAGAPPNSIKKETKVTKKENNKKKSNKKKARASSKSGHTTMLMGFRKNKTKKGNGKAGPGDKQVQAQSVNSHTSQPDSQMTLLTVPMLKDVQVSERAALFATHLSLCQQTYNFMEPSSDLREKERKRQILLSLVDHINGTKDVFNEAIFPDVIAMVSANLFRDLPAKEEKAVEAEDEEPMLEPAWPHLQIVYEFLLRYVVSQDVDAKVAKKYISQSFIIRLLQLFNSEDPRERDYLKTILHRIYGKFMALRAFVRRSINNVFYQVMYEGERHNGVGELLEILGSIINGFALPLKAEHKRFLARGLIPLHKVRNVVIFHQQLAYCVTQFVEKDPKMAEPIIMGLLRFWPNTNSPKQCLFLNELEDVLELIQLAEFEKVMVPLFKRIALCLDSPHFQVAERTLFLWNNEYLISLVAQNRHTILPLLIAPLEHNANNHWNPTVTSLTQNVLKLFVEMDKDFYNECNKRALVDIKALQDMHDKRNQRWSKIVQSVR